MPCYHPLDAWRSPRGVFFRDTPDCSKIKLPCGRCIGCRLERSRQWAVRLVHENRFHARSSFITLTYSDDKLPRDGSLNLKHFQDFMKRLRKEEGDNQIRFFHAGEYGEKRGRPHYHAIVFGQDFRKKIWAASPPHQLLYDECDDVETSERGDVTWSSKRLARLWEHGINRVGDVTFESCAYVARYVVKKVTGKDAKLHYESVCPRTGEIFDLKPEYCTMSRRPGIGARHFEKYSREIYPSDEVVSRGFPAKPPKFYDRLLEKTDPVTYALVKDERECALSLDSGVDRTRERLQVRETVKLAAIGTLKRRYEIG